MLSSRPQSVLTVVLLLSLLCLGVFASVVWPHEPAHRAADAAPLLAVSRAKEPRWIKRHDAIKTRARAGADVVFLGDSITQGFESTSIWRRDIAARYRTLNAGISSDGIEHVLWRVQHGALDGTSPKAIVLLAGVNDLARSTPQRIAATHRVLLAELTQRFPQARILVLAVFPSGTRAGHPRRARITRLNTELARVVAAQPASVHVSFHDFGSRFLAKDGTLSHKIMYDGLHPTVRGYDIWSTALAAPLAAAMHGKRPAT